MRPSSAPRAHRDPAFLVVKLGRIDESHVQPLNDLVRDIRRETDHDVPWFDPAGGGVRARALLLYEAPSAQATGSSGQRAKRGSGIISVDNDDKTAENSWHLYREARLDRNLIAAWNVVPWYVGTDTKIRGATDDDLQDAQPYLDRLIRLLPDLRVVLAVGNPARDGWLRYLRQPSSPLIPTLACPHPSGTNMNTRPHLRADVLEALRRVALAISDQPEQRA